MANTTEVDKTTEQVQCKEVAVADECNNNVCGTCVPNYYYLPNENGIATAAHQGFRVMKRLSDNQVLILFR